MVIKKYDKKYLLKMFLSILFTFNMRIPPLKIRAQYIKLPKCAPFIVESQIDRVLKINEHAIIKEQAL